MTLDKSKTIENCLVWLEKQQRSNQEIAEQFACECEELTKTVQSLTTIGTLLSFNEKKDEAQPEKLIYWYESPYVLHCIIFVLVGVLIFDWWGL